mmetsp:Transcript_3951/g.11708  ORF Transcript_3951/g.11708 Transcript_3951/m.11708 type:complete len:139 (-) Transcript_3951:1088-1504(-)
MMYVLALTSGHAMLCTGANRTYTALTTHNAQDTSASQPSRTQVLTCRMPLLGADSTPAVPFYRLTALPLLSAPTTMQFRTPHATWGALASLQTSSFHTSSCLPLRVLDRMALRRVCIRMQQIAQTRETTTKAATLCRK